MEINFCEDQSHTKSETTVASLWSIINDVTHTYFDI